MKTIDRELAIQRAGGNIDLARELLGMLVKGIPADREEMRQLFSEGDFTTLKERVHKLHGATAYCGVPALKEASATFEMQLKQGAENRYDECMTLLLEAMDQLEKEATSGI